MDKQQRKQLRNKFKDSFLAHFKTNYYVSKEITKINLWLIENNYEEFAVSVHSTYGYHILISDSDFLKDKTI